jgi:hypothetical protein
MVTDITALTWITGVIAFLAAVWPMSRVAY